MFLQEKFGEKHQQQQQGIINLQFNLTITTGMGSGTWVFPARTHTSNVNIRFLMCSEGTVQLREETLHQVSQRVDQEVSDEPANKSPDPIIQREGDKREKKQNKQNQSWRSLICIDQEQPSLSAAGLMMKKVHVYSRCCLVSLENLKAASARPSLLCDQTPHPPRPDSRLPGQRVAESRGLRYLLHPSFTPNISIEF